MTRVRSVAAAVLTLVLIIALGAAIVVGHSRASQALDLGSGNAWFATPSQGSAALIDGASGGRITRVDAVAKAGTDYEVVQAGSSALVVDRAAGTIAKIDAATWTRGPTVPVGSPGDAQLAVFAQGNTAWTVSQAGTIVQQLDPLSMTLIGTPQTLPSAVTGMAVAPDGRLWVASQSGELRSYHDGEQLTAEPIDGMSDAALVLVDRRPVVVQRSTGEARLIDDDSGRPDQTVCLDVPTSPSPAIAGTSSDAPWLLAVAPAAGTLVISDIEAGTCEPVSLGPIATSARYGTPVEKDHLIFVPDLATGQAIVVDPRAPAKDRIRTRIDLGVPVGGFDLLLHHQHVWFDSTDGDIAGVITDDLRALKASKTEAGSSTGSEAEPRPADPGTEGEQTPDGTEGGADPSEGGAAATTGTTGSDPTAPGIAPPGAVTGAPGPRGAPHSDGPAGSTTPSTVAGPAGSGSGSTSGAGAGKTTAEVKASFSVSPANPATGEPVTFTDTSTGEHSISQWTIPGGTPNPSKAKSVTVTFANPGTIEVVLTIESAAGAKPARKPITIDTTPKVPDLRGMTPASAQTTLEGVGLTLGTRSSSADSVIPNGLIVDSTPPMGAPAKKGTAVNYRDSGGGGIMTTVGGPTAAQGMISRPARLASDLLGNIYIADWKSNQVKKMAPSGAITVIAGTGAKGFSGDGGAALAATFNGPIAVTLDADGNLYVADEYNFRVRRIATNGVITTIVGDGTDPGFPPSAKLAVPGNALSTGIHPTDLDVTPDGRLWIAARWQAQILEVTTSGVLSPFPVPPGGIQLTDPASLEFDANGAMYVAEPHAKHIVRLDTVGFTRIIGTGVEGFNGDGLTGTATQVHDPDAIRFDGLGNLYFPDWGNQRIRRWSSATLLVDTVAGNGTTGNGGDGGKATDTALKIDDGCCSSGLVFDSQGNLVFSDLANDKLRKVWVAPPP